MSQRGTTDRAVGIVRVLTPDRERLAEALAIERLHGPGATAWIAARIGALVVAGDAAGVERFQTIAVTYDRPRGGTVQ